MFMMPLALVLTANMAQVPTPTPAQANLAAADYAFADKVEKQGIRTGFLSVLRDDSTVFIPRAVSGVAYYKTQLELGAVLKWAPTLADVSQAGDFGYTTAPWTYQASKDESPSGQGWFVTIWQREANSPWKVRMEIGIPTPDPADRPMPAALPRTAATLGPVSGGAGNPAELMEQDRAFSAEASKNTPNAYKARIDEKVRFYRKGRFPVEGAKSLTVALDPGNVTWVPAEAILSASGDMGCTRGTLTRPEGPSNYLRVWKKQGSAWKVVLDLEYAMPAKQ